MRNKFITIYLPDGKKEHFTTSKDVEDKEITLVSKIICRRNRVYIEFKEGKEVEGYSYVRIPYVLNTF